MTQMLGVGPWMAVDETGSNADGAAFSARFADAYVGDLELEVTSGETPQTDFLRDHGEGLYDLGFLVDDVDDPDTEATRLADRGGHIIAQIPASASVVDIGAGGVALELVKPGS